MDTVAEPFEPDGGQGRRRFPLQFSAGLVIVVLLVLLAVVVTAGVLMSRSSEASESDTVVTIAELRADPDAWDEQDVTLSGSFDDVRSIPYLDQYALYTFRDETGSMRVLSRNGAPAGDEGGPIRLQAVYHSRVKLDQAIQILIDERLGGLVGGVVGSILPDVPLDVVFLEHTSYEPTE